MAEILCSCVDTHELGQQASITGERAAIGRGILCEGGGGGVAWGGGGGGRVRRPPPAHGCLLGMPIIIYAWSSAWMPMKLAIRSGKYVVRCIIVHCYL